MTARKVRTIVNQPQKKGQAMSTIITQWWCKIWASRATGRGRHQEKGSVTIENVIWALAVIAIAAVVVAAITSYVVNHSNELLGT